MTEQPAAEGGTSETPQPTPVSTAPAVEATTPAPAASASGARSDVDTISGEEDVSTADTSGGSLIPPAGSPVEDDVVEVEPEVEPEPVLAPAAPAAPGAPAGEPKPNFFSRLWAAVKWFMFVVLTILVVGVVSVGVSATASPSWWKSFKEQAASFFPTATQAEGEEESADDGSGKAGKESEKESKSQEGGSQADPAVTDGGESTTAVVGSQQVPVAVEQPAAQPASSQSTPEPKPDEGTGEEDTDKSEEAAAEADTSSVAAVSSDQLRSAKLEAVYCLDYMSQQGASPDVWRNFSAWQSFVWQGEASTDPKVLEARQGLTQQFALLGQNPRDREALTQIANWYGVLAKEVPQGNRRQAYEGIKGCFEALAHPRPHPSCLQRLAGWYAFLYEVSVEEARQHAAQRAARR